MISAIDTIKEYFNSESIAIDDFFRYINNKVIMVYISSSNLEDSIQLFNVINDRGIRLRYIDTLKAVNLRKVPASKINICQYMGGYWELFWVGEGVWTIPITFEVNFNGGEGQNSRNIFDDFWERYTLWVFKLRGRETI